MYSLDRDAQSPTCSRVPTPPTFHEAHVRPFSSLPRPWSSPMCTSIPVISFQRRPNSAVPSPRRVVEGSHPDPRLSGFGSPRSQRLGQQAGSRPYTGVLGLAARTLPLVEVDPPSARRQPAWDHNTWSCAKPLVRRMAAGSLGFSPAVCWEESDTTDHLGNSSNSLAGRVGAPTPRQRPPDKRLRPTNDSRRPDERVLIDAAVTYIKQLQQLNRTREDVAAGALPGPSSPSSAKSRVTGQSASPPCAPQLRRTRRARSRPNTRTSQRGS